MTAAQTAGIGGASDATGIDHLKSMTAGSGDVTVGVIDGPVNASHPALAGAKIETLPGGTAPACALHSSVACQHGTFVAGLLFGASDAEAPGICPAARGVVRPIFCEEGVPGYTCPEVTPAELARAVVETVDAGARVINLSVGLGDTAYEDIDPLAEAFDHAFRRSVILVAAAGNHGRVGHVPLFRHPWVIPVAACDAAGRPVASSNLGIGVGRNGLMAPGEHITGLAAGGGVTQLSGTSVAAPFVTGAIALLWSLHPHASAHRVRRAILRPEVRRRSVVPPRLDGDASLRALRADIETEEGKRGYG